MLIAYFRVSTDEQDIRMQVDALQKYGYEKSYKDEGLSGKNLDRPGLAACLDNLRTGDTLIVYSLSRLSRSVKDSIELIETLNTKGCDFKSHTENIDTTGAMGRMIFIVIAAMAQLERDLTTERRIQGTLAAKLAGVKFGRKEVLSEEQLTYLKANIDKPYGHFIDRWGVSRSTIARAKKRLKDDP